MPSALKDEPIPSPARLRGEVLPLGDLRWLRTAIDESGQKHEGLAAEVGVSFRYFSDMYRGERTWTLRHVSRLPREIRSRFHRLCIEDGGGIVVEQARDQIALELLIAVSRVVQAFGLTALPEKCGPPVKAKL